MALPQLKTEKFSYADLLTWPDDERWELIDGIPYDMSPAPRTIHQGISGNLFTKFHNFFHNKKCRVFAAPFDVRLAKPEDEDYEVLNVVQPDITVICNPKKMDKRGAIGAPDLIVEILSDSTAHKDIGDKLLLYQQYGVREYWIVDPDEENIKVYLPDKTGKYLLHRVYRKNETIVPCIFPKLKIRLKDIFW